MTRKQFHGYSRGEERRVAASRQRVGEFEGCRGDGRHQHGSTQAVDPFRAAFRRDAMAQHDIEGEQAADPSEGEEIAQRRALESAAADEQIDATPMASARCAAGCAAERKPTAASADGPEELDRTDEQPAAGARWRR